MSDAILEAPVLVLNKSFYPIHVTTVGRAFAMLFRGVAKVVGPDYSLFSIDSWMELRVAADEDRIRTVSRVIKVPKVILLVAYDRIPRREVRFSRYNIFLRDNNICQYCGKRFPKKELTIDHVIPRSRGGKTVWENVVTACVACNTKKGNRTPQEAGMSLIRKPYKPDYLNFLKNFNKNNVKDEWKQFLSFIDAAYWNVELENENEE